MDYSSVIGLIKNYGTRSFFYKYFLRTFIPFLILFGVISGVIYSNAQSRSLSELEKYAKTQLVSISYIIENIIREADNNYLNINISNPESIVIFRSSNDPLSQRFASSVRDIQRTLRGLANPETIHSIYLYSINSGFIISTSSISPNAALDDFNDIGWMGEDNNIAVNLFAREINYDRRSQVKVLTAINPIYHNQSIDGYFITNFDYGRFVQIIRRATDSNGEIYLIDGNGYMLLSTNSGADNIYSMPGRFGESFEAAKAMDDIVLYDNDYMYLSNTISRDLFVVMQHPQEENMMDALYISFIGLIILLLVITAAGISFFLTFNYYKSIFNIVQVLQDPGLGQLNGEESQNEISFISASILSILNKQSVLENELLNRLVMLNKAQALSLQSQLNPHFLFNTIHMISSFEMAEHKKETSTTMAISLLGDILREALDTSDPFISLEREIAYSQKYLDIVNLKYANKIRIDMDVDPEHMNLFILKLSIQPLLENAVNHGLAAKTGERVIKLSTKKTEGDLIISIYDNGVGMDDDTYTNITKKMETINIEHKHNIGLINTNQRIKLIFGDSYGCRIIREKEGTTVEMLIPAIQSLGNAPYGSP